MIADRIGVAAGGRVSAEVDGEALWFASPDADLTPSGELFATALLIPSALSGASLEIAAPVSAMWLENAARALDLVNAWWGGSAALPRAESRADAGEAPSRRFGLCFSGGVDSFHTLLRGDLPVDVLIFGRGFDIPLADAARYDAYAQSARAVADACGVELVRVATNVREHPATAAAHWNREHGAAMAAAGHALAGSIGHLLIAASYPYALETAWGSHWKLDPLWSSARLRVHHCGAHLWRTQKLQAIMDHPLVQRHLRVCWEHRSPAMNCGRCEKCLRTQIILARAGRLERFAVFDSPESLARRIDEAEPMTGDTPVVYEALVREGLSSGLDRAVRGWLDRTHRDRARRGPPATRVLRRVSGVLARVAGRTR